jgi:hypothetical protein
MGYHQPQSGHGSHKKKCKPRKHSSDSQPKGQGSPQGGSGGDSQPKDQGGQKDSSGGDNQPKDQGNSTGNNGNANGSPPPPPPAGDSAYKETDSQAEGDWFDVTATHYGHAAFDSGSDPNKKENMPTCESHKKLDQTQLQRVKPTKYYAAVDDSHQDVWGDPSCGPGPTPQCTEQKSCGQCYEVRCVAKFLAKEKDFHNKEHTSYCTGGNRTAAVMVIDACPLHHHINDGKTNRGEYNPCGGEFPNMDVGPSAFERLARAETGIIHAQVRRISCDKLEEINDS